MAKAGDMQRVLEDEKMLYDGFWMSLTVTIFYNSIKDRRLENVTDLQTNEHLYMDRTRSRARGISVRGRRQP